MFRPHPLSFSPVDLIEITPLLGRKHQRTEWNQSRFKLRKSTKQKSSPLEGYMVICNRSPYSHYVKTLSIYGAAIGLRKSPICNCKVSVAQVQPCVWYSSMAKRTKGLRRAIQFTGLSPLIGWHEFTLQSHF
jgi:hypothetical protein